MPRRVWLDFETYNECPITVGTYKYAETVELTVLAYAFDDEPAKVLDLTLSQELPVDLREGLIRCEEVWAHNSGFDSVVYRYGIGVKKFGWPVLDNSKWMDTMVQAYEHGLPGSLDQLCGLFNVSQEMAKIKDGRRLVLLFCKPLGANRKLRRATRETHPEDWVKFLEYARTDVEAMRAVYKMIPKINYPWNNNEVKYWHNHKRIIDRGVRVDLDLVNGALEAIKKEQLRLKSRISNETEGEVKSATEVANLLKYISATYEIDLRDLTKSTVREKLLESDVPEEVRSLLEIRQDVGKASTAKYSALINAVSRDGRLRGILQFRGANRTGRYSGRVFQPHNLPSRGLPGEDVIEEAITATKKGVLHEYTDKVMNLCSYMLRGTLIPDAGKKFLVADWSNIEGRLVAWSAKETWKVEAFRDYDAGTGHDLYKLTYAKAFNKPVEEVTKSERQLGKVLELACGYQGGVGAFITFATGYNVDLDSMAASLSGSLPEELVFEAERFYDCRLKEDPASGDYGLSKETFIACDVLKRSWRRAHPNVVILWRDLEDCARAAINNPGHSYYTGNDRFMFECIKGFLFLALPSGRVVTYAGARIDSDKGIRYQGQHKITKKWCELSYYGGLALENCAQALSAQILDYSIDRTENSGLPVVLHVHDEITAEVGIDSGKSVEDLERAMTEPIPWLEGMPLKAEGFECLRYRK